MNEILHKLFKINGRHYDDYMPVGRWIAAQDRDLWHRMPSPSFLVDRFIINERLMTVLALRWAQ